MDIYRGNIYAEKNFFKYALFVSFFPQLVAGPIERSKNLLKQLAVPHKFDFERAKKGILLMIWGFFLKIVLADRIAIFVDAVYGDYQTYIGWYVIFATILFALQIYCDFYGYSVIAMGTSTILGIQLMENFDAPYISTSVSGFWRKWHISLTSWFKDYLYIPLGGSRKGRLRKYINKLIVFLTSGLWHGAEFSFIVWGGLIGLYQIIGELLSPVKKRLTHLLNLNRKSFAYKLVQAFITFLLIDFSWIFFRATCLKEAFEIINQIFTASNMWIIFDGSLYNCGLNSKNFTLMIICILILIIADMCKCKGIKIIDKILKQDSWFQLIVVWSSIMAILLFGIYGSSYDAANFIYFQF